MNIDFKSKIIYRDEKRNIELELDEATLAIIDYYSKNTFSQNITIFRPICFRSMLETSFKSNSSVVQESIIDSLNKLRELNLIAPTDTISNRNYEYINPAFLLKTMSKIYKLDENDVLEMFMTNRETINREVCPPGSFPYVDWLPYLRLFWEDEMREIETSFEQRTDSIEAEDLKNEMNETIKNKFESLVLDSNIGVTISDY